jgi:ribonuclease VapC
VTAVLDASAVLALLRDEPGAHRVLEVIEGSHLPTTNLAEVLAKHDDWGLGEAPVVAELRDLGCTFVPITVEDARLQMRVRSTDRRGPGAGQLSLADRLCLAVALRLELPVLTADRAWGELGLDVDVWLIR